MTDHAAGNPQLGTHYSRTQRLLTKFFNNLQKNLASVEISRNLTIAN